MPPSAAASRFTSECGIAIVHGAVSGNTEVIDIDMADLLDPFVETLDQAAPGLYQRLCVIRTPRPGYHLIYRCEAIEGNQKLAMMPAETGAACLIETRGEGGYTLAPGSPGVCHLTGRTYEHQSGPPLTNLTTITPAEREALLFAARSLDRMPKQELRPTLSEPMPAYDGESPGDAYARSVSWADVLEPYGWQFVGDAGGKKLWRRPGKTEGVSATTGCVSEAGNELLCVFSTNAHPLPGPDGGKACSTHSKFDAYARLKHGGDHSMAAKELLRIGYGDRPRIENVDPALREGEPSSREADWQPDLVCLADVKPSQVDWLWDGRVAAGRLSLLVGNPGIGKSFLTCYAAMRVTTGSPWPDGASCCKGSVLFITAEDDASDTIRPRLDACGADVKHVHLLRGLARDEQGERKELMFSLADVEMLERALQTIDDCRLIIIDPIGSFLGGRTDAHRDNEVRAVLAPISKLAEASGAAVLLVAHRRKSGAAIADETVLGSRAFTGLARSVWHLSRDPDWPSRRLLLPGKNNLGPEGNGLAFTIGGDPARLIWETDPVEMTADDAMALEIRKGDGNASAIDEAARWLREKLLSGPKPGKELIEQARKDGISRRTLERAKAKLGVQNAPDGFGGPWLWRMSPTELSESAPESAKDEGLADSRESRGKRAVSPGFSPEFANSQPLADSGETVTDSAPEDDPETYEAVA